jgi:hypothetical protein
MADDIEDFWDGLRPPREAAPEPTMRERLQEKARQLRDAQFINGRYVTLDELSEEDRQRWLQESGLESQSSRMSASRSSSAGFMSAPDRQQLGVIENYEPHTEPLARQVDLSIPETITSQPLSREILVEAASMILNEPLRPREMILSEENLRFFDISYVRADGHPINQPTRNPLYLQIEASFRELGIGVNIEQGPFENGDLNLVINFQPNEGVPSQVFPRPTGATEIHFRFPPPRR